MNTEASTRKVPTVFLAWPGISYQYAMHNVETNTVYVKVGRAHRPYSIWEVKVSGVDRQEDAIDDFCWWCGEYRPGLEAGRRCPGSCTRPRSSPSLTAAE